MAIPNYQQLMLPVLKRIETFHKTSKRELTPLIADDVKLNLDERTRRVSSGNTIIQSRIGWTISYLKQAGLVEYPERGKVAITDLGKRVLLEFPPQIDNDFLKKFDSFKDFIKRNRQSTKERNQQNKSHQELETSEQIPEEQIASALVEIESKLAGEILDLIQSQSPQFFEKLVVELLLAMGYGGAAEDSGLVTSYTNDEGIDGFIKEDKLGLDMIYLQAKRWQSTIGRPEIQKFVGALQGKRAKKGVFISTSRYSSEAMDFIKNLDCKVVLIDGEQLAKYMIEFNVGVQTEKDFAIKKIDEDYWD